MAFLTTAVGVLVTNAVLAVALGCCAYGLRYAWLRFRDRNRPAEAIAPSAAVPLQSR